MSMHSNGGQGKVANQSAMGQAESIKYGSQNLAIVHGRVRDDTKGGWAKKSNAQVSGFFHGSFAVSFFDLFKVSKMTILILTCSKSAK